MLWTLKKVIFSIHKHAQELALTVEPTLLFSKSFIAKLQQDILNKKASQ